MTTNNHQKREAPVQELSPCRSGDESMTDGIFTVDLDRRINTFFNRAAEEITDFSFAEAAGQFCFDILRSSTCQIQCPLERTLQTGESVYNHSAVIITRKGKEIPVSVSTALTRDRLGKVTGAVEIFRDLSVVETLRKTIAVFR